MVGIEDVWPDDPTDRIRITVEAVRSPVSTATIADRADVTEDVARQELLSMADQGWVSQSGRDEWTVDMDALNADGLLPTGDE